MPYNFFTLRREQGRKRRKEKLKSLLKSSNFLRFKKGQIRKEKLNGITELLNSINVI